ncbi:MAG: L,D-transpeptidase [Sporolactobacillus sp.]
MIKVKPIENSRQLILVTAKGYETSQVKIQTFSRNPSGKWKRQLCIPGIIGKYGFAETGQMQEGGLKSPQGLFNISQAFGRWANPGTKLLYHLITPDDVWVDNVESPNYNTMQSLHLTGESSEKMYIPQYDYGFVINYNTVERIPGKGSAIFFHIDDHCSDYTAGCTAVSRNEIVKILKWLDPGQNPIIIQTVISRLKFY